MAEINIGNRKNTLWDITVDGREKTALATGIPNRVFQGADMSRLRTVPGYIWDGQIREWAIEGMGEWDGQIIFWGERLELSPIDPAVPFTAEDLAGLAALFRLLREKSEKPAFSGDGFFRLAGGGLFCFPLNLMEFIHSRQARELLMSREIYNHPDLKGEERLSHTLAILAFQSLTGRLPYTRTGGYEWIHEEMRKKKLPSLRTAGAGEEELRDRVDRTLRGEAFPSLEEWLEMLKKGPSLTGTATEAFSAQMEKLENSFVKSFDRRKNQVKITLSILGAAAVLWVGIMLVRGYLAPPYTAGMTPREVVEAYYGAINALDSTAIDGTCEKKTAREVSTQVATMYVMSRNKQAYGQGETIPPDVWADQGYPALGPGDTVYGVGDLAIEDLGDNRFEATYLAWYPAVGDPEHPEAYVDPHEIFRKKEVLTVIRDRRDRSWIIGGREEEEITSLSSGDILPR